MTANDAGATMEIAFDLLTPVGVFPWKIQQEWIAVDGEWMAEGRDEWMTEPRETAGNPFATPAPDPE